MSFFVDGEKLSFHPRRVGDYVEGSDVYPIYVEVSPVGACNHRCVFCSVDYLGYQSRMLETGLLVDRLNEMYGLGVKSVMFAGEGEPLLHKGINRVVESIDLDVSFTTNGVLLDKLETLPKCKWVKVSLNGGDRDTYSKIHRCDPKDWDRVWGNLKFWASRKGDCSLGVQSVVLKENLDSLESLMMEAHVSGVDYLVLKPYTQAKYSINRMDEDSSGWVDRLDDLARKHSKDGFEVLVRGDSMKTKAPAYKKCKATPYFWCYVMSNWDVYSCSAYLNDSRFIIGNLKEETFKGIWEGEKRRKNKEYVRSELDISECRVNCRMDKVNRYLTGFDDVQHVNFI